MKNTLALLIAFLLLSPLALHAQECMGVTLKPGSGYEMLSYDSKGKENGRMVYKIKNVSKDGPDSVIEMEFENFDKKDKSQTTNTFKMRCNGNEMRVDAASMMPQGSQFESFDLKFTSKDIIYPANLSVGQKLPDGSFRGEGATGPMTVTMDADFTNRKVESKEQITVPAGTFDVFKISSDMNINMKTVMKVSFDFSSVSYRSPKVLWDIKTETYRKGKLSGSTVLSKIF